MKLKNAKAPGLTGVSLEAFLLPTYGMSTNMSMTSSLAMPTTSNGTIANVFLSQKAATSLIQTNGEE
jgi:hypothetical protein